MNKFAQLFYNKRVATILITLLGWLGTTDNYHLSTAHGAFEGAMILSPLKWISISVFFAALLTLLLASKKRVVRIIGYLITALYAFLSLINAIAYQFWGFGISNRMFTIMMESNDRESGEFLNQTLSNLTSSQFIGHAALFLALTAACAWAVKKINERGYIITLSVLALIGLIASGIQMMDKTEKKNVNIIVRTLNDYHKTHQLMANLSQENSDMDEQALLKDLKGDYKIDNVVIVIGESASRRHHSLYGYDLNTTPRLLAKRDELVVFNDAISTHSTTSESLKRILSYKNCTTHPDEWYTYPSLPAIFSHLGYQTYWLSNQEKIGFYGGCEDYFSNRCDTAKFVGMIISGDNLQEEYDEALLPELSKVMRQEGKRKFVVLHMMGSHGEYHRRYPKEFAFFTAKDVEDKGRDYLNDAKKKVIAQYENSIRYSDYVVDNILDTLQRYDQQGTLFLYFSDHGEEVYEKRDFSGHTTGYVDVPFILWANEKARQQMGDKYEAIRQSTEKAISLDNLPDFLLGISDIELPLYDATLDFSSPSYRMEQRFADDLVYEKGQCD